MGAVRKLNEPSHEFRLDSNPSPSQARGAPQLVEVTDLHAPTPSPQHEMMATLEQALSEPVVERWSKATALTFMIGSAAALWVLIGWAIVSIF